MSMMMEQVVTLLQQELFTLRAHVAAESGFANGEEPVKNFGNMSSSERYSESS